MESKFNLRFPVCIIGLQWGDEGKGKIVDCLSEQAKYVVRYQGGPNAGHTLYYKNNKIVLRHIPAGVLHSKTKCVISNGVVVDPEVLLQEIKDLEAVGISVKNRLFISDRAHVIFPFHKEVDKSIENSATKKLGTTLKGVGPCYNDKISRIGIRFSDLKNTVALRKKLETLLQKNSKFVPNGEMHCTINKMVEQYSDYYSKIKQFITDTIYMLNDVKNDRLLFEGAHGALLSIEFGTYPYVTSSCSDSCGTSAGTGVSPKDIKSVIGISKAYTTRVGEGPFPTELTNSVGDELQKKGNEFGSATGRKRRVGWLDLVGLKYACMINGVDTLVLTKLDVLSGFKELFICTGYKYKGSVINRFPADPQLLHDCKPVLKKFIGWSDDISQISEYRNLPHAAKEYVKYIEQSLDTPIKIISVGKDRWSTITR